MSNDEQIAYWNGEAGQRWAQEDETMARLLRPVSEALLAHADVGACSSAIDVGCGGGSQSMMLAAALPAGARVLGVDLRTHAGSRPRPRRTCRQCQCGFPVR